MKNALKESCQLPEGLAELHLKAKSAQGQAAGPPSLMDAPAPAPTKCSFALMMSVNARRRSSPNRGPTFIEALQ